MRIIRLLVAMGCALTAATATAQAAYPSKPIKIIVAYAAGQGTDIATRYVAEQMSRELGQPIVVENKPGAGGNLGTELAALAAPDGYTLTMGTNATHSLNQFLYAKVPFEAERDFEPIGLVGTFPMVMAVNTNSGFTSAAQMMEAAKASPRAADIAIPSTTARLVVELLKDRSSVSLFSVPYKGSGAAMTDVLGGQLPVIVDTPTALRSHLAAGKVRAIAVTSSQPSSLVPGVKTVAEQGYPGFEVVAWNALYTPKNPPPAVVATLNSALNKVLARPETLQKLLDLGFEPAGGAPSLLSDFAKSERTKWGPIIKTAGIRAD